MRSMEGVIDNRTPCALATSVPQRIGAGPVTGSDSFRWQEWSGNATERRTQLGGRFPEVDWYCDECDEYLNDQAGFDDGNSTWTCVHCGQQNNISSEAILSDVAVDKALDFLANFDPKKYKF